MKESNSEVFGNSKKESKLEITIADKTTNNSIKESNNTSNSKSASSGFSMSDLFTMNKTNDFPSNISSPSSTSTKNTTNEIRKEDLSAMNRNFKESSKKTSGNNDGFSMKDIWSMTNDSSSKSPFKDQDFGMKKEELAAMNRDYKESSKATSGNNEGFSMKDIASMTKDSSSKSSFKDQDFGMKKEDLAEMNRDYKESRKNASS